MGHSLGKAEEPGGVVGWYQACLSLAVTRQSQILETGIYWELQRVFPLNSERLYPGPKPTIHRGSRIQVESSSRLLMVELGLEPQPVSSRPLSPLSGHTVFL